MAKVLLIEDDDAQRFVARFALQKAGHEVREAPDGPQGVAAAQAEKPEVIVCDVMMPGMTGYEVVATLRNDPELVTVPVILLTAMSDRKHMRQGMTAGADDYLTKPYRPDELCEAISAALARRDAFMSSLSGVVEDALAQQKETLAEQYENQLVREINGRWGRAQGSSDVSYDRAFVLLADLLGPHAGDDAGLPGLVKQLHQSARDTLYLFGASHVLPYGRRLLAIFPAGTDSLTTPVEQRVLRAAQGLLKAAPKDRPATVALHAGPVVLVAVHDGLHGDQGHSVVPGDSIAAVSSLNDTAAAQGWRLAASEPVAGMLRGQAAPGARADTARGEAALQLLPVAAP